MASTSGEEHLGIRRRLSPPAGDGLKEKQQNKQNEQQENPEKQHDIDQLQPGTYWLTRIVLLRSLAFVYVVAFLVALHQNRALLGKKGLLPADRFLQDVMKHTKNHPLDRYQHTPTFLWFMDYKQNLDLALDYLAYAGLLLSGIVLVLGSANIVLMLSIWLLYHSIVNVGQRWYSFGWESQLLETGFLAAFLCPLFSMNKLPRGTPTSIIVLLGFRWLIFRIMLGAGLIKLRGDKCWWDLTCMNYHYQTQPVPNPISYYMHQSPEVFHKIEVLTNHFVELVAPFFIFLTRRFRLAGGIIQIMFQVVLIISGNLSFLNWLTILPSIACFDDTSLSMFFSNARGSTKWKVLQLQKEEKAGQLNRPSWGKKVRSVFNISLGVLLAYLSIPIVQNLVSTRQIMNTSFDPLRIVNTYGAFGRKSRKYFNILWGCVILYLSIPVLKNMASARQKQNKYFGSFRLVNSYGKFGSITKERTEVIFQGTYAEDPQNPTAQWEDYEFKCKPGNTTRRPCLISPYHYRLDWLMWFAAFQNYQYNNWLVHLAAKFLANDQEVLSLIEFNPFEGKKPPRWVRAEHYRYTFTKIGGKLARSGKWWRRTRIGNYLPPVSLDSLKDYLKKMGWPIPRLER